MAAESTATKQSHVWDIGSSERADEELSLVCGNTVPHCEVHPHPLTERATCSGRGGSTRLAAAWHRR
jgi:hypothetical protein